MRNNEVYMVVSNALNVADSELLATDSFVALARLRDSLTPKRVRACVKIVGPQGETVEGPMSLRKAEEKVAWFSKLGGLTATIVPAPILPSKPRKPRTPKAPKTEKTGKKA